jgi:hypothetical protein
MRFKQDKFYVHWRLFWDCLWIILLYTCKSRFKCFPSNLFYRWWDKIAVLNTTTNFLEFISKDSLTGGGGGGSVSFGTVGQIPYTNSGGTNFNYSANFKYDGTAMTLLGTGSSGNVLNFNK